MEKYVNDVRLQQALEAVRDRLLIKDKTEAQALVQSANYPNCVYYTTDTHAIVVGGVVYSRSVEITNAFMYANSTQDQGSWNHNTLYIVPGDHAGEFNIWGYTSSNWYVVGTTSLNIATDAVDINYDATNSKLDADNVQDAIDEVVEDVSHTGKYIGGWVDDNILPNNYTTEYPEGSTIGAWETNASYGCRGVKLPVKEGDKLLLDTFSPMRYGLYFTDENLTVVSRLGDRRFDGVYTSPCDGYAYIIDVLYRENFIYDKAHGYLAYKAFDAWNSTNSAKDYPNIIAPHKLDSLAPFDIDKTPTTTSRQTGNFTSIVTTNANINERFLIALHVKVASDNVQTGCSIRTDYQNSNNNIHVTLTQPNITTMGSSGAWATGYLECLTPSTTYSPSYSVESVVANQRIHLQVDKVFMCQVEDYPDAVNIYKGLLDGSLNPSNANGLYYEIDNPQMTSIRLTSTMNLGYDIFERGAEMPVDNAGFVYGASLKGTAGKIFGAASSSSADQNLVYLPAMDWSNFTGTKLRLFLNCYNLITIPDITWGSVTLGTTPFQNCYKLKKIGNLPSIGINGAFLYCRSLESVGNMTVLSTTAQSAFGHCYSLKSIGTISGMSAVTNCMFMFQYCKSLEEIPDLDTKNVTTFQTCFSGCVSLRKIASLDLSSVTTTTSWFNNCTALKEMKILNIGKSSCTTYDFTALTNWGNDNLGDGYDSLIDTISEIYDRTGGTKGTIKFSANTYDQLSTQQKNAIVAKNYDLYRGSTKYTP